MADAPDTIVGRSVGVLNPSPAEVVAYLGQLVPPELRHLLPVFLAMLQQESGLRQFGPEGPLTSPAGAIGIAQLMPATAADLARRYGVRGDWRTDWRANVQLGLRYFLENLERFSGNIAAAVAAYNAGPGRVHSAMAAGGRDWERHLPEETRDYLRKVRSHLEGMAGRAGLDPETIDQAASLLDLAQGIIAQGSNLANLLATREQQRREARFGGLMEIAQALPKLLGRALPSTEYLPGAEPGGAYEYFARLAGLPFTPMRTASIPSVTVDIGALRAAAEALGAPTAGEGLLRLYLDKLNQIDVGRFTEEAQRLLDEGVDVFSVIARGGPDEDAAAKARGRGPEMGGVPGLPHPGWAM